MLPVCLVLFAACDQVPDNVQTIRDFERIKNSGDVAATLDLFAEDAVLNFQSLGSLRGHEQIRNILGYDVALQAKLRHEDCKLAGEDVTCVVVESNDWLGIAGIDSITYEESRYSFDDDGRILSVSTRMSAESVQALGSALTDFHAWATMNVPREYKELFSPDGEFVYSQENGEKVLELLRRWKSG